MEDDERAKLSTLIGKTIEKIRFSKVGEHYEFMNEDGVVLFTVGFDELFDETGNRFNDDL